MSLAYPALPLFVAGLLAACSPALNWREARLPDAPVQLLFPCKPERTQRGVPLDGAIRSMTMLSCDADGLVFALTYARVDAAADRPAVLSAWQRVTLGNLSAAATAALPVPQALAGATAQGASVQGRRPDGRALAAELLWFAVGPWAFQASVLTQDAGPMPAAPAAAFWAGIRTP
ncbi:MAG: hypothetical protein FGM55_05190 [Rhodoferax sp.]|nr:hypothetical protein [Rhodoferax sp.]